MCDRCGPCLVWAPDSLFFFQGGRGVTWTGQMVGEERSGNRDASLMPRLILHRPGLSSGSRWMEGGLPEQGWGLLPQIGKWQAAGPEAAQPSFFFHPSGWRPPGAELHI